MTTSAATETALPTPVVGYQSRTIHGTTDPDAREGGKSWTLCGVRVTVREIRTAGWEAIVLNRWTILCRTCLAVSGSTLPPEACTPD